MTDRQSAKIQWGEWLPDLPAYENPGMVVARGALPLAAGYDPFSSFSPLSTALDAKALGHIAVKSITDGTVFNYSGNATKLYSLTGSTWNDVSRTSGGPYATAADEHWEFVKWGNKVIGVNFTDDPQQITLGAANFSVLTTALRARHIAVVREFIVMGSTFDGSDGERRNRIRWSGINNETQWTPSAVTLSDFQDIQGDSGGVQHISGGDYGLVFFEGSVWRMTFEMPIVFRFEEVQPGVGLLAPRGVVKLGDTRFFISTDGFMRIDGAGTQLTPIGQNKVTQTFFRDLKDRTKIMAGKSVGERARIFWAYVGSGSLENPNRMICYDVGSDRWSQVDQELELLSQGISPGYTLEDLDAVNIHIDELPASLDSAIWQGGAASLIAFGKDHRSGSFSGLPYPVTLETGAVEIGEGRRACVRCLYSNNETPGSLQVLTKRYSPTDAEVAGPIINDNGYGKYPYAVAARYMRLRANLTPTALTQRMSGALVEFNEGLK